MKKYLWDPNKNKKLIEERQVSFDQIINSIENGGLLDRYKHPNMESYPNQYILVVNHLNYCYLVPIIETKDHITLKTIFPSRKATKKYLGEAIE